nr:hypothetical protein [Microcoleus asticus]
MGFSFKYLQTQNEKFSIRDRPPNYFTAFLERVRDLSTLTAQEVKMNRSQSLRCHPIKWRDTTEPNGFGIPNEKELVTIPYQFSLSTNEHGRVHGFFIEDVFYIVWLDPNHNLYQ